MVKETTCDSCCEIGVCATLHIDPDFFCCEKCLDKELDYILNAREEIALEQNRYESKCHKCGAILSNDRYLAPIIQKWFCGNCHREVEEMKNELLGT